MVHKVLCLPFALFALVAGASDYWVMTYAKPHSWDHAGGWPVLMSVVMNLATTALVFYFWREDKDFEVERLSKVVFIAIIILSYGVGVWAAIFSIRATR